MESLGAGSSSTTVIPDEVRKQSRQSCIQSFVHAYSCRDTNCQFPSCQNMKDIIQHTRNCERKAHGGCPTCQQFSKLSSTLSTPQLNNNNQNNPDLRSPNPVNIQRLVPVMPPNGQQGGPQFQQQGLQQLTRQQMVVMNSGMSTTSSTLPSTIPTNNGNNLRTGTLIQLQQNPQLLNPAGMPGNSRVIHVMDPNIRVMPSPIPMANNNGSNPGSGSPIPLNVQSVTRIQLQSQVIPAGMPGIRMISHMHPNQPGGQPATPQSQQNTPIQGPQQSTQRIFVTNSRIRVTPSTSQSIIPMSNGNNPGVIPSNPGNTVQPMTRIQLRPNPQPVVPANIPGIRMISHMHPNQPGGQPATPQSHQNTLTEAVQQCRQQIVAMNSRITAMSSTASTSQNGLRPLSPGNTIQPGTRLDKRTEMVAAGSARINGIPPNPNVWQTTKINRQSRVIFTKQPQNEQKRKSSESVDGGETSTSSKRVILDASTNDQDDGKTVAPSKVTKDWHHSIPDEIREHFLMQLVAEIGELNVKSDAWKTVKKIELEIYESAETRAEYIDRMAGKLVEFEIKNAGE